MSTVSTTPLQSPTTIPHRRVHHGFEGDAGWDAWAIDFDTAGRGEIEVCALDFDEPDSPAGVDLYRPVDRTLTVDEARRWINALQTAVEVAERVNRGEEQLQPKG